MAGLDYSSSCSEDVSLLLGDVYVFLFIYLPTVVFLLIYLLTVALLFIYLVNVVVVFLIV